MKPSRSLVKAFLIFPFNVMGVIPTFLIWFSRQEEILEYFPYDFNSFRSIVGILMIIIGIGLCWKTVSLLTEVGGGTPSPFSPTKKLVIQGPYLYVCNPMMIGVWMVLSGEAMFFGSVPLGVWFLVFFGLCLVLIPVLEEPDLERRFGEPYREYRRKVPRWIPQILPDKKL
jgi:protein-S-isoprenylcysteine O-methyltransferase Ste14